MLVAFYLKPLFLEQIDQSLGKINERNKTVVNTLGKTKPPIRRSTRYKPVSQFSCKHCSNTFPTIGQLKTHKISYHTSSLNSINHSDDKFNDTRISGPTGPYSRGLRPLGGLRPPEGGLHPHRGLRPQQKPPLLTYSLF